MVNTVGSCRTKHWHKKWIPIKKSLVLTPDQRSIIIGSLLGDGTMRIGKGAVNANFKIEHCIAQKEYVMWKYGFLKSFVFTEPKLSYRYKENGQKYAKSWWFRTVRHPTLTKIYNNFYTGEGYRTGKKIIPLDIDQSLNPLALAIWIMDDGSYQKGRIDISTYSFSLKEINLLRDCLEKRFKIKSKFYQDRDIGYRMYLNKKETDKLIKTIYPYIINSMMYKIGFTTP